MNKQMERSSWPDASAPRTVRFALGEYENDDSVFPLPGCTGE